MSVACASINQTGDRDWQTDARRLRYCLLRTRSESILAISCMISRSFLSVSPSRRKCSRSRCAARSLVRPNS